MELAKRDIILNELNKEIEFRKKNIQKKQGYIKDRLNENEFLSSVAEDYKKYNDYIVRQREQQEESFRTILDYLDRLIKEGNLTEEALEHTKAQHRLIINEIDLIKRDLDEIIKQ